MFIASKMNEEERRALKALLFTVTIATHTGWLRQLLQLQILPSPPQSSQLISPLDLRTRERKEIGS